MPTDERPRMAYVGRAACGCGRAVTVDDPSHAKDTAREIARWIRAGLTVERVDIETARGAIGDCRRGYPAWGKGCPQTVLSDADREAYRERLATQPELPGVSEGG